MKSLVKLFMISVILAVSACSHHQVMVHKSTDPELSCSQISAEMVEMEKVMAEINENTGVSGRNVGMALVFWPGIFVNQMNATDARRLATERMQVLANLQKEKGCIIQAEKAAPTPAPKEEAKVVNTSADK